MTSRRVNAISSKEGAISLQNKVLTGKSDAAAADLIREGSDVNLRGDIEGQAPLAVS